jgi:putative SOS response-associated peptidase YedK
MCGRYALYGPTSRLQEYFEATIEGFDFKPRYNTAPMQWLPVIRQRPDGARVIHALRWGLLPGWAKDEAMATRLINARGETVAEKPAFRAAMGRRRCIVPMNGFYEWQARRAGKQPHFIRPVDDELLGVAGLWERWVRPADGEVLDTYTIVTIEANLVMAPLHDRMPVILPTEAQASWLNNRIPVAEVIEWVRQAEEGLLRHYPAGKQVGSVRNDGPELIELARDAGSL